MALTPEIVANKRFTPVRLREGYDMGEVDSFLDEVEEELGRLNDVIDSGDQGAIDSLTSENIALKAKVTEVHAAYQASQERLAELEGDLSRVRQALADEQAAHAETPENAVPELPPVLDLPPVEEPEEVEEAEEDTSVHAGWPLEPVTTTEEASNAARKLLELATTIADELVSTVEAEVSELKSSTEHDVAKMWEDSRSDIETAFAEANEEVNRVLNEVNVEREMLLSNAASERAELEETINALRAFENDYRASLATYFAQQLESIQGPAVLDEVEARNENVSTEEVLTEDAPADEVAVDSNDVDETVAEDVEVEADEDVSDDDVSDENASDEDASYVEPEGEVKTGFETGVEVEDFSNTDSQS